MPIYEREEVPASTSWIGELNALQAIQQCRALGVEPRRTLEQNRAVLRQFVRQNVMVAPRQPASFEEVDSAPPLSQGQLLQPSRLPAQPRVLGEADRPLPLPENQLVPPDAWVAPLQPSNVGERFLARPSPDCQLALDQIYELLGPPIVPQQVRQPSPERQMPSSLEQAAGLTVRPQRTEDGGNPASHFTLSEELMEQMRSLNMQAIAQTAQAVAQCIRTPVASNHQDNAIPSYVRDIIRELPKVNGTDAVATVRFLKAVSKLLRQNLASERAILLNATTCTAEPFRQFWIENVTTTVSWSHFLFKFNQDFLTPETRRTIQNQMLYRTQGRMEKLADFVKDIEASFEILSPETESQVIFETIFCRINPDTRNHLAGLRQVNSIQDLIQASRISESIKEQVFDAPPKAHQQTNTNSLGTRSFESQRFEPRRPNQGNNNNSWFRSRHTREGARSQFGTQPSYGQGNRTNFTSWQHATPPLYTHTAQPPQYTQPPLPQFTQPPPPLPTQTQAPLYTQTTPPQHTSLPPATHNSTSNYNQGFSNNHAGAHSGPRPYTRPRDGQHNQNLNFRARRN